MLLESHQSIGVNCMDQTSRKCWLSRSDQPLTEFIIGWTGWMKITKMLDPIEFNWICSYYYQLSSHICKIRLYLISSWCHILSKLGSGPATMSNLINNIQWHLRTSISPLSLKEKSAEEGKTQLANFRSQEVLITMQQLFALQKNTSESTPYTTRESLMAIPSREVGFSQLIPTSKTPSRYGWNDLRRLIRLIFDWFSSSDTDIFLSFSTL